MGRTRKQFEVNEVEATLNAVKQYGNAGASRSQVVERTGFDVKTVQQVLKRVTEDGNVTLTGKKRGVRYVFNHSVTPIVDVPQTTVQAVNNQ